MVIKINYGEGKLALKLPDHVSFDEYMPAPAADSVDIERFNSVLSSAEEESFHVSEADLFVLNDAYRPTPTAKLLEWISNTDRLNDRARFLIATGCHPAPGESQLEKIFGNLYQRLGNRIIVHNADDPECLAEVGKDLSGESVFLNKVFLDAEKVIVIGSVEPHYFAGFTGGRKSIFPGLCDFDTTVRNHNLAVDFAASPMKLEANPVEEHLQSLMKLVHGRRILSIQVVPNVDSGIGEIFCGSLEDSFREAKELSSRVFGNRIKERYDLLLAEVRPPLDGNLYQLQKSLENCQQAVADSGTIILFSPCREGIGLDSFFRLAENWNHDEQDMTQGRGSFGKHKLDRVYRIGRRIAVYLYSELAEGIPDRVYFNTVREPQKAIDNLANKNRRVKVVLVRDSGHTVLLS